MVRVLGNSSERVPIPDLRDVVYYKQIKEYTDQEYETSKDLKRELARGRLVLLEKRDAIRGDGSSGGNGSSGIKPADLRSALREILPDLQTPALDVRGVAREMAPVVAEIVRQEIARMPAGQAQAMQTGQAPATAFQGPEYVPEVTTDGMVSNVEAKKTEASGASTDDALRALREMNK